MMSCAIGMSVAAACEIIYWIILKPLVKWMMTTRVREVSPKYKTLYIMSFIVIFYYMWLSGFMNFIMFM